MTAAIYRRCSTRERDDDSGSEVSTLKGSGFKSCLSYSERAFGKPRYVMQSKLNLSPSESIFSYVNSATCIENEIFKDDNFSSNSDEVVFDDDEQTLKKPPSVTKSCRIDFSPEAEAKRKEAFEKWLNSVTARERESKRLALERLEAEVETNRIRESFRKRESEEKVDKWMREKQIEAEKKMVRLEEMKAAEVVKNKPKEFKRAINYQEWLDKKKEESIYIKKQEEERKLQNEIAKKNRKKCRDNVSSASYDKWIRSASSKAKPVPCGQGLESLRGSTTKIFINPEPWKFEDF